MTDSYTIRRYMYIPNIMKQFTSVNIRAVDTAEAINIISSV